MTVNEMIKKLEVFKELGYGDWELKVEDTYSLCEVRHVHHPLDLTGEIWIEGENVHKLECGLDDKISEFVRKGMAGMTFEDTIHKVDYSELDCKE